MSRAILAASVSCALSALPGEAQPEVTFEPSQERVEVYGIIEVLARVAPGAAGNPFIDASLTGRFAAEGAVPVEVDGFCDAEDGSVFRIRFMPSAMGRHIYTLTYTDSRGETTYEGEFEAVDGGRPGPVRVDPEHPWHFIWEGTGEHYFYNGTTTYFLAGWGEEQIRANLDRLASLGVTRIRAALAGRVENGQAWFENVYPTDDFSFLLNPWAAERPDSVAEPGFDVTRFNVDYWRKWDALAEHARELNVVVSVIFYVDGARPGVDPFGKEGMGGPDEQRFYRYAIARLAAYSNVMWDLANEYRFFRDDAWAEAMGPYVKGFDPYDHLTSVHGFGDFRFREAPWADFAMYQSWDEGGGYDFMLSQRAQQAATGRIMPQVNEEYGYEDHYPTWGGNRRAPARSADNRRRLAWGISMAGCYQTAGERADQGTGWGPDTGGGWINGRGDDSMVLFEAYRPMVDLFTSIPWWELEPDNDFFIHQASVERLKLTHIAYTRNAEGEAVLYLDGEEASHTTVEGDLANWDDTFRLALANELTGDRPWLGTIRSIALRAEALNGASIASAFALGPGEHPQGALALYRLDEGEGAVVHDSSGVEPALDLTIADAGAIRWLEGGGLAVLSPTLIAAEGPATKVIEAVRGSGAITIEAWVEPAGLDQEGPARIVTLSRDTSQRNLTLGQGGAAYEVRFRTSSTSPNGEPSLWSPGGGPLQRPVGLRSPTDNLAVIYLPAGGGVSLAQGSPLAELAWTWYDPRDGTRFDATVEGGAFRAPSDDDWVLLLR